MRLLGAGPVRVVLRHVMPMCVPSVIVRVTLDMAGIILTAAGLGFLGLGAQPPMPEWGAMIAAGRAYVLDQGKDAHTGTGRDLLNDPKMIELYLGNLAEL